MFRNRSSKNLGVKRSRLGQPPQGPTLQKFGVIYEGSRASGQMSPGQQLENIRYLLSCRTLSWFNSQSVSNLLLVVARYQISIKNFDEPLRTKFLNEFFGYWHRKEWQLGLIESKFLNDPGLNSQGISNLIYALGKLAQQGFIAAMSSDQKKYLEHSLFGYSDDEENWHDGMLYQLRASQPKVSYLAAAMHGLGDLASEITFTHGSEAKMRFLDMIFGCRIRGKWHAGFVRLLRLDPDANAQALANVTYALGQLACQNVFSDLSEEQFAAYISDLMGCYVGDRWRNGLLDCLKSVMPMPTSQNIFMTIYALGSMAKEGVFDKLTSRQHQLLGESLLGYEDYGGWNPGLLSMLRRHPDVKPKEIAATINALAQFAMQGILGRLILSPKQGQCLLNDLYGHEKGGLWCPGLIGKIRLSRIEDKSGQTIALTLYALGKMAQESNFQQNLLERQKDYFLCDLIGFVDSEGFWNHGLLHNLLSCEPTAQHIGITVFGLGCLVQNQLLGRLTRTQVEKFLHYLVGYKGLLDRLQSINPSMQNISNTIFGLAHLSMYGFLDLLETVQQNQFVDHLCGLPGSDRNIGLVRMLLGGNACSQNLANAIYGMGILSRKLGIFQDRVSQGVIENLFRKAASLLQSDDRNSCYYSELSQLCIGMAYLNLKVPKDLQDKLKKERKIKPNDFQENFRKLLNARSSNKGLKVVVEAEYLIGGFFVDLYVCYGEQKYVIECDGDRHYNYSLGGVQELNKKDALRDDWLQKNGFVVIRIKNNDFYKIVDNVIDGILRCDVDRHEGFRVRHGTLFGERRIKQDGHKKSPVRSFTFQT